MKQEYIDLGLPSGTCWATENAEIDGKNLFTYDEALEAFGKNLPAIEKWRELFVKCSWVWDDDRKGCTVTGPNGSSVFLPATGYGVGASLVITGKCGCYWSASPYGADSAGYVYFYLHEHHVSTNYRSYGFNVRLVQELRDNLEKQKSQKPAERSEEDEKVNAIKRVLRLRRARIETLLEKNPDHSDKKYYEGKMDGYGQAIDLLGESLELISIEL